MANTWTAHHLHGFEDNKIEMYPLADSRYAIDLGEGFLTITGALEDFKEIADGIYAELNRLENEGRKGDETIKTSKESTGVR